MLNPHARLPLSPLAMWRSVWLNRQLIARLARRDISCARFDKLTAASALPPLAGRVALSLPETPARRRAFEAVRPSGVQLFDGLRVVVTLPFLVGHHEELDSSLWGISNEHYGPLIAQAQARLKQLAAQAESH